MEGPASQSGASIGFSYYGSASVASTDVRQAAPAQGGLTATSDQVHDRWGSHQQCPAWRCLCLFGAYTVQHTAAPRILVAGRRCSFCLLVPSVFCVFKQAVHISYRNIRQRTACIHDCMPACPEHSLISQVCLADLGICVDPLREGGARAEQSSHPYLAFGSTRSSGQFCNATWATAIRIARYPEHNNDLCMLTFRLHATRWACRPAGSSMCAHWMQELVDPCSYYSADDRSLALSCHMPAHSIQLPAVEDLNEDEWEEAVELPSLPLSSTRKAASRKDDTGRSTSDGYMRPAGYQKVGVCTVTMLQGHGTGTRPSSSRIAISHCKGKPGGSHLSQEQHHAV